MYADFPGIQQPNSNLRSKHQLAALYRYLQQENQNDAAETLLGRVFKIPDFFLHGF